MMRGDKATTTILNHRPRAAQWTGCRRNFWGAAQALGRDRMPHDLTLVHPPAETVTNRASIFSCPVVDAAATPEQHTNRRRHNRVGATSRFSAMTMPPVCQRLRPSARRRRGVRGTQPKALGAIP